MFYWLSLLSSLTIKTQERHSIAKDHQKTCVCMPMSFHCDVNTFVSDLQGSHVAFTRMIKHIKIFTIIISYSNGGHVSSNSDIGILTGETEGERLTGLYNRVINDTDSNTLSVTINTASQKYYRVLDWGEIFTVCEGK